MTIVFVFLLLDAAAIFFLFVYTNRPEKDSEWTMVEMNGETCLMDGRCSTDQFLMGRKVRGEWQYREMTPEERNELLLDIYF